jgi:kexin
MCSTGFAVLAVALALGSTGTPARRTYATHNYCVLHHNPNGADIASLAASLGAELVEQVGELAYHWLLRVPKDNDRNELNVSGAWNMRIAGKGAMHFIVNDGLDYESEDLSPDFVSRLHFRRLLANGLRSPLKAHTTITTMSGCSPQNSQTTRTVRGVLVSIRGGGAAYNSQISGVRIISGPISDVAESGLSNYAHQRNDI